jgi:anti-sigma B factor antagonist
MLQVSPRLVNEVLVLDCTGRMAAGEDLHFFHNFMKELLLTTNAVVVNLDGVTYMDSGGLSVLIGAYTSARHRGTTMKLANVHTAIRDLFRITRLLDVFEIHENVDEALKRVPGRAASA